MRNHMDKLTERQRREVAEGPQTGRSWADLWLGIGG